MNRHFTVKGTQLTYEEFAKAVVNHHLFDVWKDDRSFGDWTLEMAYLNESPEGFTGGFRVLGKASQAPNAMLEVTWVREDNVTTMSSYLMIDEVRSIMDPARIEASGRR